MPKVVLPSSLATGGQFALNAKSRVNTLEELQDLGSNNIKAFSYEEDLLVRCIENHTTYIWRERLETDLETDGILEADFTYPAGLVVDGIEYSNRDFNFFVQTVGSAGGGGSTSTSCLKYKDNTLYMCNVQTIFNDRPLNFNEVIST